MNYKEALDAAFNGHIVKNTINNKTFQMRYKEGGFEWDWGHNGDKWYPVTAITWGAPLTNNLWEIVRKTVSTQEALQAVLNGKRVKRQGAVAQFQSLISANYCDATTQWEIE